MTMDNTDYVSYELAKKLKECGFDWHTRAVWHFDGEDFNFIPDYGATFMHPKDIPHWNESNAWGRHIYSAPCLWQAQKWLREKKKWHVEVRINGVRSMFSVELWKMEANGSVIRLQHRDGHAVLYDDYESALSAGISAALELIGKEEK